MHNINENKLRIGNFTASEIHRLMSSGRRDMTPEELEAYKKQNPKGRRTTIDVMFGEKAMTYIDEKNIERELGRSISVDFYSTPTAWGKFMEQRVFDKLEMNWSLESQKTKVHPLHDWLAGTVDVLVPGRKVGEIKCYEPKKFIQYVRVLLKKDVALFKSEFPEEYWQIVCNASIHDVKIGEAIAYMPYESELSEIREAAENYDGPDQWQYRFIAEREKSGLAYLPDGGKYKNLNRFEFEVPQSDLDELIHRVVEGGKLLITKS